jgi:Organic solute transporter Ostalpha
MYGIIGHLTNYNCPGTQVYVVRILWMVPLYSIQSWLAMRFHKQAVFIETLRDFYESYVLYSFLQFLIEVLGGEEALILMLKDKSPTRGVHMWGLQWCVKPWLMGQPIRREVEQPARSSVVERVTEVMSPRPQPSAARKSKSALVHWKSPFFIKCKFGVLQYVLLKFLTAVAVLLLEWKGWYKEGEFHWKAGYLYICILTNVSQCWALYCLIFFYYATKTELSPIRPVGKFLSVKSLVFFTWWQSVFISVLYQMDMIPNYKADERDWSSDDVAKGIQDYLICIEMFIAAVVHTFVFPHSEYSVAAVRARANSMYPRPVTQKRLGRRRKLPQLNLDPQQTDFEMMSFGSAGTWDDPTSTAHQHQLHLQTVADSEEEDSILHGTSSNDHDESRPGLFRAIMDSAIPRDLRDNTVNIMRGEYNVEKKTLLHHAATSDQYDLFSNARFKTKKNQRRKETGSG